MLLAYGLPAFCPPWRGGALLAVTVAGIAIHVLLCRYPRGRHLPVLQWLLLVGVAVGVWV